MLEILKEVGRMLVTIAFVVVAFLLLYKFGVKDVLTRVSVAMPLEIMCSERIEAGIRRYRICKT